MEHIIGPVEAYAVAVARMVWHQFLVALPCFYFIDNNAAMDAFVRGNSRSSIFRDILLCFEDQELRGHTWPWFTRVPSPSNCSDDPSRGKNDALMARGAVRDTCLCPITRNTLSNL
jgi:hypothetical protein